jgi:ribonuclease P protein component
VSTKVSKRAVQRNRLRRQLHHHVLHLLRQDLRNDTAPVWLLISLKPGCQENGREGLLEECSDLLRKAGLCP